MSLERTTYELTRPQNRFFNSRERFPAFVGGFGSGKTTTGTLKLLSLKFAYPKIDLLYTTPSYPLIRDIFYPTVTEILEGTEWEQKFRIKTSDNVIEFGERGEYGKILCRTLHPDKLIGFKVGAAVADEIDVLPMAQAEACWNKIISRIRQPFPDGYPNQVMATTTPEGFKFCHKFFGTQYHPDRLLVRASTDTNPYLPQDYVDSLYSTYPPQLVKAYINGLFVNLFSGSVYIFDRNKNGCTEEIATGEDLHIGMDFNVNKMATVIHVIRQDESGRDHALALDEIMGCTDTPDVINAIKGRYGGDHKITVYPDASGGSRDTRNASRSDISLLKLAGFKVDAPKANPLVRDRVLAVNHGLRNYKYWVNIGRCPETAACLEQQVYAESGAPDKSQGKDHAPDALGYFINRKFPVVKRKARVTAVAI